jgi:hypothetical protein
MARLGYPKAFAYVFLGFGCVMLVRDVLNGSPDPPLAFLLGHYIASLFEKAVFFGGIVCLIYGLANSETRGE